MADPPRITEGSPEPLGASLAPDGINIAVHAPDAAAIEFCLFEEQGQVELTRITLPARTGPVWHGHIEGVGVGARYGLRAHGPFDPAKGLRFNPHKLLLDPYALRLDRPFGLDPALFGYRQDDPRGGASFDETDSAPFMPKAIVTAPLPPARFAPPPVPWARAVIYELHVRGFTRLHPDIPEPLRGTFAGLAHPAAIAHLKVLGVTTVELMPAMAWIDERHLPPLGLTNYWGYNPVALLAPDPRLAPGGWADVHAATEALAAAGIETILDVVLNHSGEGDALGPTLSLRGLDNGGYYRLRPDDLAGYVNDAGTGNILALDRPAALRLALDSLRAWRRLGGMAGFRFDLATVLGRRADGFDPHAPLLAALEQDPELRLLKRIAEPWDSGPGGYQLGRFPPAWGEWNDRFRDAARSFWRGDPLPLGALAPRLAGSQDLLPGRRPSRGVNFVVAHDGFTLADLVSYAVKHNDANGEEGRDGADDNRSWNNGVEGPTDDPMIKAERLNDQRALLATLILARGTPMLAMGSDLGQSQDGNNNAYCQDNAIGWLDWARADTELSAFAARLIAARTAHPALHADCFLSGEAAGQQIYPDVAWRRADGATPQPADWDDPRGETLVMVLSEPDGEGLDRVAVVIHRGTAPIHATLPEPRDGFSWTLLADSGDPARTGAALDDDLVVGRRSVVLLAETPAPTRAPRGVDGMTLAGLSAAAGIAQDWWGLDGQRHPVSPDTQAALLTALRLPAATTQQALASLRSLAEKEDRRPLPAFLGAEVGRSIDIPVRFDPGQAPPSTWLTIEGEDGAAASRLRVSPNACRQIGAPGRDGRQGLALNVVASGLPTGRYRLRREDRPDVVGRLTVAPAACYMPPSLAEGRRVFGLSAQLYSIRRTGDQGIGDFSTLGALADIAAQKGAAWIGLNPLHALFPDRRDRASPYYPSDRRFLEPLYLDLAQVPFAASDPSAAALSDLAAVDYPKVWFVKAVALEKAFAAARDGAALDAFIAAGGAALERFATFAAISETRPGQPWRDWPKELHDPDGPGVKAVASAGRERVRFHQWLQWQCELQLAQAAQDGGALAIGLGRDLAVGAAPDGAEAWAQAPLIAQGVSIGAPPDPLGPLGQVWGLPPFDPHRLKASGYDAIASLYAANMRHAGALRIDHVMGLARQFWVPDGADGADGAYVAFPLHDLLGELALESERARCLVIGEDLGAVPDGLHGALANAKVLSYRVLPFERDGVHFKPPSAYPALAMACVATHDLPTLIGWWKGLDIAERLQLGLLDAAGAEADRTARAADKQALLQALAEAGLSTEPAEDGEMTPALAGAIHAYIALTPSILATAQVEDLAGEQIAVNLPGTDQERPNWRRRLGPSLDNLLDAEPAPSILAALRAQGR